VAARPVNFLTFFLLWARLQGWKVPMLHVRMCVWMETCDAPERVLMVFRGAAKSTLYAIFKAWRLYRDPYRRSLVWSADNDTAGMLTADVINVLRNHPLCGGMLPRRPGARRFWVTGAKDARNASMRAVGVNTNATGARADDVDFDDIEVPGNIETPESRAKLRRRISESTHIAVPGAQKTYIGTPHTHDSIYPERIAGGAAVLKICLFEHSARFAKEMDKRTRFPFPHPVGPDGLYVMAGIHKTARMLIEGRDYVRAGTEVVFAKPPGQTIDIASLCQWPERFDRAEIEKRRRETLTFNAWDSQYMLEAKPLSEVRLDPDRLLAYDAEPRFVVANGELGMWLGKARIVGASCRWDPSGGKLRSDASSVAVVLQDDRGRRYWHRAVRLTGEVAVVSADGKTIEGGQVLQLVALVRELRLPRVTIETNGIGGFAPTWLKAALRQHLRGMPCGVSEEMSVANKNRRILEAIEAPLSSGMLWAHVSVLRGPAKNQMRDWNPATQKQPDDDIDALAGAITETPERVNRAVGEAGLNAPAGGAQDWRPDAGVHEVEVEY
jgi:hypothetical protein